MNKLENQFAAHLAQVLQRERTVLNDPNLKPAAVLVPIIFRGNTPHLIFTRRTMYVTQHKGQISFPGGASEPEDESVSATALRETQEEIGLEPDRIHLLGKMDDFVTISGFLVTPVVGIVPKDASFQTDDKEVDELFEEPLAAFQDPQVHELIKVDHDGTIHEYHSYELGKNVIWGATAGIIHRLVSLLNSREKQ